MLLITKNLSVPKDLRGFAKYSFEFIDEVSDRLGGIQPKHLIPLGEADWPEDVKNKIAEIFKKIGVPDPMKQKLVEPYARGFKGKVGKSKEYNFEEVNWEIVVYYFKWEAACWIGDYDEADRIKEEYYKKDFEYDPFWHYGVYGDPFESYY
ncbi:hypothetical protein KFV02_00815 [Desulfohalobiaceae bacterium Ax17]|uniref:hypothetical protein n=1 Tax=Desulfovulcanus ferrireducens TaxID=2831190 RepID=UPI00207BB5C6|nr:hypothetical protein [Desulfovulcanus ferrireducens]MBT8762473.1 hypothetical protein [Desulfovulcanus ferrireducens]